MMKIARSVIGFVSFYAAWAFSAMIHDRFLKFALVCAALLAAYLIALRARLFLIRALLGLLFLIFGLDKLGGLEHFAESIDAYQMIPTTWTHLAASLLAPLEAIIGCIFIIYSVLDVARSGRFSGRSQLYFQGLHMSLLLMLGTFCVAIIYGLFTNPYMDCGCGDAWNPIDVFSKSLWFTFTGEVISGLDASLFRNLCAISLVVYSLRALSTTPVPRDGDISV
jgi:hypothetical protein